VRKERHFVDYSKIPKPGEVDKFSKSKKAKQADAPVSTKFDISEELIQKSPLSYEQY